MVITIHSTILEDLYPLLVKTDTLHCFFIISLGDIAAKMNLDMNEEQLQELTGEDLMKQREQAAIKEAKKKNSMFE